MKNKKSKLKILMICLLGVNHFNGQNFDLFTLNDSDKSDNKSTYVFRDDTVTVSEFNERKELRIIVNSSPVSSKETNSYCIVGSLVLDSGPFIYKLEVDSKGTCSCYSEIIRKEKSPSIPISMFEKEIFVFKNDSVLFFIENPSNYILREPFNNKQQTIKSKKVTSISEGVIIKNCIKNEEVIVLTISGYVIFSKVKLKEGYSIGSVLSKGEVFGDGLGRKYKWHVQRSGVIGC